MKINPVSFYSPNSNIQSYKTVSKPVNFCALSGDDAFVKSKTKNAKKDTDLSILLAASIMANIETKKAGKIIYSNAKNAFKAGKKVKYKNYAARVSEAGENGTKMVFSDFDEKTNIPRKFSLVDPNTLKTVCVYEFEDTEHPLDSFKLTRYDSDGIYEHQMQGKKVTAFSQKEYGSDVEKAMILNPYGFSYIEAKVSDEEGVDPEITQTLSYSVIKNNETAVYREYKDGVMSEYLYNPNEDNWAKASK